MAVTFAVGVDARQPLGVQVPEWPWPATPAILWPWRTARHGDCWGRVRRAVHAARARSLGLEVEVVEAGDGVGGTWYWNRYPEPGATHPAWNTAMAGMRRCSRSGSGRRNATQPEILAYLDHVCRPIRSSSRHHVRDAVEACSFDEATERWTVQSSDGEERIARFVVMATGCLSSANLPAIPGRDDFGGRTFHTGRWPHRGSRLRRSPRGGDRPGSSRCSRSR